MRLLPMRTYHHNRRLRHTQNWLLLALVVIMAVAASWYWQSHHTLKLTLPPLPALPAATLAPGDVLAQDSVQDFTAAQTTALAKQNYGAATLPIATGITKITFHYRSELPGGQPITVYGRAYLPANPAKDLPIFAFAPGTTGIGDKCAPSLEQPHVSNWANYDSHMAMYASQGFAAVTTDYEGMRDADRIHHYMVGELEGRAVLDSIRALRRLPQARGRLGDAVFVGGYSQGGHAAFWADKIAASYAPEVKIRGVVGFGPVMSVQQTLIDVIHGANINWFGPYVVYSYQDYYHEQYGPVLLPHWADTLATDVPAHCIDTDLPFWGHTPANVYTPEFLAAAAGGTLRQQYPDFARDLERNEVGVLSTPSAKRINQGAIDNVVLPSQQAAILPGLCRSSSGPVELAVYPGATHYDTMVRSLADTLGWMRGILGHQAIASTCPQ